MARWYATFNNSTNAALEAPTVGGFRQRVPFPGGNGEALRSALIATRDALSSEFYNSVEFVNRNGNLGTVVPVDGYTRNGGSISGTNLYQNAGAQYPAEPRIRPAAPITIGNSTPVSPVDAWSVSTATYDAAQQALEDVLTALDVRGRRIVPDVWRLLGSLHYDADLTYIAWDDFLPGTVQNLTAPGLGNSNAYTITPEWMQYQYLNDENPDGRIQITASLGSLVGGHNYSYNSGLIAPPSTRNVTWEVNSGNPIVATTYELVVNVQLFDAVIPGHAGTVAQYIVPELVIPPPA